MLPASRTEPLETSYRHMLALCDRLEAIADALPRVERELCLSTADILQALVEETQALEESMLFPLLIASGRADMSQTVARLRQEHLLDSGGAQEVSETLRGLAGGHQALPIDAVGYLLRAFFEGMRRHLHGELDLLGLVLADRDGKASD